MKERIELSLVSSDWNRAFEKSFKHVRISKLKSGNWLRNHTKLLEFVKRFPEIQSILLDAPIEEMNSRDAQTRHFSMDLVQNLLNALPSSLKSFTISHFACGLNTKSFELVLPEDKQLRELCLLNCKRADNLTISNCSHLNSLSITWTKFFPKMNLNELKNLKNLNISHNKGIDDEVLDNLMQHCTSLERLSLVGCESISTPFRNVSLTSLKVLDLSATNVTDGCLENICNAGAINLEDIKLRTCMSLVNPSFKDLPSIKFILTNFNSHMTHASFFKLGNLERIDLDGCTSLKKAYIFKCPSLTYLDMSKTLVSDEGLEETLQECKQLKSLLLTKCYKLKSPRIIHDNIENLYLTNCSHLTIHTVLDCPSLVNKNVIGTVLMNDGENVFFRVPQREDIAEAAAVSKQGRVKKLLGEIHHRML